MPLPAQACEPAGMPFEPMPAVTRRPMPTLRFARCELRLASRELLVDGTPVPVQRRVFDVLALLAAQAGRLVAHDELLAQAWPHRFVSESVVARAVMKARRAIHSPADGGAIESVRGCGYRFDWPVQVAGPPPVPADAWIRWVESGA